jgi:helicase MOV-10
MFFLVHSFEWYNPNIHTNPEQMQAIHRIVNGSAYPSPYIIFGPPGIFGFCYSTLKLFAQIAQIFSGTGKTMTIVETVCQLWKMIPKSRILVTAQSNSACDEIAKRLLKILPASDILRFYTPSFEKKLDMVDEELLEISNLKTGQHQYPGYDEFYGYRVVACTLVTAGR